MLTLISRKHLFLKGRLHAGAGWEVSNCRLKHPSSYISSDYPVRLEFRRSGREAEEQPPVQSHQGQG